MSQIDDLPPLREVIAKHGLNAKKSLGQNFLLDLNLTLKIAKVAGPLDDMIVVEVGPGPGGLTRALLAAGAQKVIAIEKDARAIGALEEISARYPQRLEIIEADALEVDMATLTKGRRARIVANLPYNVATPLLTGWLLKPAWPPWYESMTLMLQKEVAERIVAPPGSKTYERLSVLTQALCEVAIAFDVPPQAFVPAPKVTSSVVYFRPKPEAADVPREALEKVTQAAFGQRRKMLRQSLKGLTPDIDRMCADLGLQATTRAEQLGVTDFLRLAGYVKSAAERGA